MKRAILIVKNRGMGDAVMGLSSLDFLKRYLPASTELYYAIPGWLHRLFAGRRVPFKGLIDSTVGTVQESVIVWRQLVSLEIDWIFELNQEFRTARFFRMLSTVSGTPYFFHNHHALTPADIIHAGERRPTIQRDLDGVYSVFSRKLGLFSCDAPSYLDWVPNLAPSVAAGSKAQIILGVVASTQTKRWPLESFARLTQLLYQQDPRWRIIVPISGSKDDQEIAEAMARCAFSPRVERVRMELDEIVSLLEGSLCYAGNDTGLKHICVALGIPTVTLFGPLEPAEWHPYRDPKHAVFFESEMPCRYEHSETCLLTTCSSMVCLKGFDPEEVASRVVAYARDSQ